MLITIRPYEPEDFEAAIRLWHDSRRSTGLDSAMDADRDDLRLRFVSERARGCAWWIAIDEDSGDGEPLGLIGIKGDTLDKLYVAPALQGRGIGRHMLDFVKEQRPDGFRLFTARANPACRFYAREGLWPVKVFPHPDQDHDIVRFEWRPGRTAPGPELPGVPEFPEPDPTAPRSGWFTRRRPADIRPDI